MLDHLDLLELGIYSIQGRNFTNRDMLGKHGFTLMLNSDFAKTALDIEVTRAEYRAYQRNAKAILSDLGLPEPIRGYPPLTFVKSRNTHSFTGLINFCTTPGFIHDLMLESSYLEILSTGSREYISYRTVNVNDSMQSEALLQMWQKWLETIADAIIWDTIIN